MKRAIAAVLLLCACTSSPQKVSAPQSSRSLALSADGKSLWVVNTESDSISQLDLATRTLAREVLLGGARPAADPITKRYDPVFRPRALALAGQHKAYVAAQAANAVIVVDTASGAVVRTIATGAEPVSVVASQDGAKVYVVNHQSATVQAIDTQTDAVTATLSVGEHPWGISLSADGKTLFVSHLLLHPGLTTAPVSLASATFTPLADQAPDASGNKVIPNGQARGAYAVVPRPGTGELWVAHLLLATATPQPSLDFQSTVFPTLSLFSPDGLAMTRRLLFRPGSIVSFPGAFIDSVSGPRDVAFTPDGKLALVAMAQSEDVMAFDADSGDELALVRPVPSALIEGIVVDASGTHAYAQGRSSHNVSVLTISPGAQIAVDGDPIDCLSTDPMPANLRLGQRLFYSSNSSAFPITQDFWVACSSCHLEGQSDAVTWQFAQGPRDTPSNAGGPINTGFLFRQAMRNDVVQYDQTIRIEQGGAYHRTDTNQLADLQALADFTNYAIPLPENPNRNTDGTLTASQQRGKDLFGPRCASCHGGDWYTDSGAGNPTLDLAGPVVLHDIGTCVTAGQYIDNASIDVDGGARVACQFDTPTLRGIFATAPYLHDGSAATLDDLIPRLPNTADLTADQRADLVAFLKTL